MYQKNKNISHGENGDTACVTKKKGNKGENVEKKQLMVETERGTKCCLADKYSHE